MGTRTPGLLHAINRQHIHGRASPQATVLRRAHQSPGIQPGCGTFALYSPERPPASAPVAVLSWLPGEATAWRAVS